MHPLPCFRAPLTPDRKNGCVNNTYLCDHLDGKEQTCRVGIFSAPSLGLYSQHFILSVTYVSAQ